MKKNTVANPVSMPPGVKSELPLSKEGRYEKLYHMLWTHIPFSLLLIDRGLRVASANFNFIEKARRTEENTIGRPLHEVFPETILTVTQLATKICGVFDTGQPLPSAQMSYNAPGIFGRIYYYTVIPVKAGKVVEYAMLVMDDITEKVRLSEQVRMAERHLASVVESANDLVISTDAAGRITSWSAAAERITGYPRNAVRGLLLIDLCESRQRPDVMAIIQQLLQGAAVELAELNLVASSGVPIPVDWSFSPIRTDSGQVCGIVAVGRDLSERRAFEQHLFQSEKLAALGVMAGGIAHELRNPLSVSFSAAQFLLEPSDDPVFQQECARKILDGIQRASMIIENLLRFARPSSGNQTQTLNLIEVVQETLSVLQPQAKLKKIKVVQNYDESWLAVCGNANLLQQVVMNLVLNAFQAMPAGGVVEISVRREAGAAVLRVHDTGGGIAPAHLDRIFEPFFTTQPVGKGTGLGLSICHALVQQHKGGIEVQSPGDGQGCTFIVRLPLDA